MALIIKGVVGTQHGRKIITGFVSARDLARLYEERKLKIDEYSISNPDGYQREHSITRARKFANFIANKENGISPTNILIYLRQNYEPVINGGNISIPDEAPLFIVDGQHRTVGISEAYKLGILDENEDFDVPISLLIWNPEKSPDDQKLEEAMQFYTINTQLKRPRTDLAHQYIYRVQQVKNGPIGPNTKLPMDLKKKDYVPFEIYIAEQLYKSGPWKNLIIPPNGHEEAPISQGSFTDSLGPVLEFAQNAGLTMGDVIELINNYWSAITELCPESHEDWDNSLLMKTSGVFSLHLFLPLLLTRKRNLGNLPTKQQLQEILSNLSEHFSDSFWNAQNGEASKFGGGKKAFTEIYRDIIEELDA